MPPSRLNGFHRGPLVTPWRSTPSSGPRSPRARGVSWSRVSPAGRSSRGGGGGGGGGRRGTRGSTRGLALTPPRPHALAAEHPPPPLPLAFPFRSCTGGLVLEHQQLGQHLRAVHLRAVQLQGRQPLQFHHRRCIVRWDLRYPTLAYPPTHQLPVVPSTPTSTPTRSPSGPQPWQTIYTAQA